MKFERRPATSGVCAGGMGLITENCSMARETNPLLRTCIASILLAAASQAVMAAESSDTEMIQEVVITGSYLEGTPVDTALPVIVLNEEVLNARGSPSLLDVLRSLPESQGTAGDSN